MTAVYASPMEDTKNYLWRDLTHIGKIMSNGWLVAGDFNDILHASEKRGVLLLLDADVENFKI